MIDWTDFDRRVRKLKENVMKNAIRMKQKYKQNGFTFKPFSKKQKQVLTWWCEDSPVKDKDGIIADGAIRSGKTLCMSLSYAESRHGRKDNRIIPTKCAVLVETDAPESWL